MLGIKLKHTNGTEILLCGIRDNPELWEDTAPTLFKSVFSDDITLSIDNNTYLYTVKKISDYTLEIIDLASFDVLSDNIKLNETIRILKNSDDCLYNKEEKTVSIENIKFKEINYIGYRESNKAINIIIECK